MTDVLAFYNNERRADPTRTLTLRERWVTDWNVRIAALKKVIKKSVVDNDGFGLKQENRFLQIQAAPPLTPATTGQWAYRWSHEKVAGFMGWLREMEERSLLEIVQRDVLRPGGEPWSNIHVRSAYQRGLAYALDNIRERSENLARNLGLLDEDLPPAFRSTGGAISALMNQPFHADRLALAYTRTFDELKGVTAVMDQQISRVLAEGLAQGLNPRQIGDKIADRVEKIGGTRGRLIARTEVINVHQQAALNEYYASEQATGEVFLVEWNATLDSRTRDTHMERHERVYTKEEAYALIGEPNCRCALLPYIPAVQGMPKKATQAAKEAARKAIEKSELEEKKDEVKKEIRPKSSSLIRWKNPSMDKEYQAFLSDYRNYFDEIGKDKLDSLVEFLEMKFNKTQISPEFSEKIDELQSILKKKAKSDFPTLYDGIESWQSGSTTEKALVLKEKALAMEEGLSSQWWDDVPDSVKKRIIEDAKKVSDDEYLRLRAFNQAYMERLSPEFELHRGTGGEVGREMARLVEEMKKSGKYENKSFPFSADPPLVGYSDKLDLARRYGTNDEGVNLTLKIGSTDILVHKDLLAGITGRYYNEREFIILGRLREVFLSQIEKVGGVQRL